MLIEEMLSSQPELERLLRDSYANYVIQTAIDYAGGPMKTRLIEAIRPILPSIRSTPYGRRIQAKIQGIDNRPAGSGNGTPPATGETVSLRQAHARTLSNASQGGFNPASMAFSPLYGSGITNGRPPVTIFPSSTTIAQQGLSSHPALAQQYQELAKPTNGRSPGVNGVNYF